MLPSNFEEANILLLAAPNLPPSKCYNDIPAFFGVEGREQMYIYVTAWIPSKEDMDALKEGRPIMVKIYSDKMPSLSLFTQDEEGKTNE